MSNKPKKNGRPRIEIDYKTLEGLCGIQCIGEECASVMGIDYDTLDRALKRDGHGGFADFFKLKRGKGRVALRRAQYKLAVDQLNPTMLIWLGKQHLEQKDKSETEIKGGIAIHIDKEDAEL